MSILNSNKFNVDKIMNDSNSLNEDYLDNLATKKLLINDFKEVMKSKYEYLFKNHESIFNIAIGNNYDSKRLKNMLLLANKVHNSEITEHEASVTVGTDLVENIVKPQLDKAGVKSNK